MNSLSADVSVVPKENNAYLLNPGKGWIIYSPSAHASTSAWAKASVGYTRYMWKDIHTGDNTFNWAVIDNDRAACVARGKQFAFGVMTISVNSSSSYFGMPQWVADAGASYYLASGTSACKVPVWSDPVFTNKIGQFVTALRNRYNGDPAIAYIDCRTYGNWGEWHLGGVGGSAPSDAVLRQYIDQWAGFDKTHIIVAISGGTGMYSGGYGFYARDTYGFGYREDSVEWGGRASTCASGLNVAPAVGEHTAGYGSSQSDYSDSTTSNIFTHSFYSYMDMGGGWDGSAANNYLAAHGAAIDEWGNRMGYWFKMTSATYPSHLGNGTTGSVAFTMRNDGVAPIYIKGHRAVVKVALMDNATNVLSAVTLKGVNPFDWKPGETIAQAAEFTFPKNAKGTKLALGVFTREALTNPDVKLGIDQGMALNWYVLSDMPRGAP